MAVVVAVSVAASYSRGAVVALCVSLLWVVGAGLLRLITGERTVRAITVIIPLALLLGALGTLSLKAFDAKHTYERFVLLMDSASTTWQSRQIATTATKEMWEDQKWTGWGAGSFRFIFPRYQQRHPSITWYNPKWKSGYYYWEYAHNDWIQLLAELGVIGAVLIGTTILTGVVLLVRQQGYQHDFVLLLVGGCLTTCLHARGDFLFHNPAILNLWTACAMAALVISQLDRRESRPFIHQQKQSSSRG
jgi:O-antigen ligase